MISFKPDLECLSPRKASLRNNRSQSAGVLEQGGQLKYANNLQLNQCKNVNVRSEIENSKRKRRESHETSGSDKDDSRGQLIVVPKLTLSPTVNLSAMDLKKCKFETERERMFRIYQPWVLKTYGDSSKTKTITTKKQNRIIRTLCGMEYNNPDSSKFRYWVKVKGFTTKSSNENESRARNGDELTEDKCLLSIPAKDETGAEKLKKVAVVELFFDIIFGVHIGNGEKSRRHSGQKRTYRMITETFAFLPREAVTKFLSNCTTCMKLSRTATNIYTTDFEPKESPVDNFESSSSSREPVLSMRKDIFTRGNNDGEETRRESEATLKMKQAASDVVSTYLQLTRTLGLADVDTLYMRNVKASSTSAATASDVAPPPPKAASPAALLMLPKTPLSTETSAPSPSAVQRQPTPTNDMSHEVAQAASKSTQESCTSDPSASLSAKDDPFSGLMKDADKLKLMLLAWNYQNSNVAARNGTEGPDLSMMNGLWSHYQSVMAAAEKNTAALPLNGNNSPIEQLEETNSSGQKEDEEGSEDESDEKNESSIPHDPERLKAFNMFVRLFVDENLDRMVPISKQPKEKIQAIIDSCTRQFPEFAERARKRIRTYLKSCRRNKKVRDGWDSTPRPTPAHLTSAQAEQILAQACENESLNAKRMRIGMEPIGTNYFQASSTAASSPTHQNHSAMELNGSGSFLNSPSKLENGFSSTPQKMSMSPVYAPTAVPEMTRTNNNSSPFEFNSQSVATTAAAANSMGTKSFPNYFNNHISNVPTDLSMKTIKPTIDQQLDPTTAPSGVTTVNPVFQATPAKLPLLTHKLSPTEMNAVRQLVTGYRESAAFLLRSAEELEQLLLQQQQQL